MLKDPTDPPPRTMKTGSRSSLRDQRPDSIHSKASSQSQDDLLTSKLSPRSNTIPLIELGTSLDQLRKDDSSVFYSLDNLDGFGVGKGRQWNTTQVILASDWLMQTDTVF